MFLTKWDGKIHISYFCNMSCGLSWYLSSSTRHSSKILCIFSTLSKHLSSSSFFYWRGDPYLHSWRAHLCPLSFWVDCFLLTLIIVHDSIKRHPKGSPALQSNLPYFLYGEAIQFPPAVWIIHPSNTFSFLFFPPSFLSHFLSSPFLKISLNVWMFCLVCMSVYFWKIWSEHQNPWNLSYWLFSATIWEIRTKLRSSRRSTSAFMH